MDRGRPRARARARGRARARCPVGEVSRQETRTSLANHDHLDSVMGVDMGRGMGVGMVAVRKM